MSLARNHFARVRTTREAAIAAPATTAPQPAGRTQADRMLALLRGHKAALKGIQSQAAKIAEKARFLPEYAAYVDGVLAAGNGQQDTVLVTVMLWHIDTGNYGDAMGIATYALRHGLAMPEGWKRDLPTSLIEELAEAALKTPDDNGLQDALTDALDVTAESDMPDEVRAKAHKALGFMVKDESPVEAVERFETALSLDAGCGVKTELARLKKALTKTDTDPAGDTPPAT